MEKPSISIIIPAYNTEKTIIRALDSVVNQTYDGKIEIIVVNDGSTDQTIAHLETYGIDSLNRDLVIFNQTNSGVSNARNKGIELATGDYIVFLDADDYYLEETVEQYMNKVQETDCEFLICSSDLPKQDLIFEHNTSKEEFYNLFLKGVINSPWAKAYQSSLLKNNGICFNPEISIGEDLLLNTEVFFKARVIATFLYEGYCYDQSESTLTRAFRENYFEERLKLLRLFKELLNEQGIDFKDEDWFHIKLCYSVMLKYIDSSEKRTFKEKIKFIQTIRSNKKIKASMGTFKGGSHIQRISRGILKYGPSWLIALGISLLPVVKRILPKKSTGASI